MKQKQWYDFYEERINSGYQDYFEERYKILLLMLKQSKQVILEEGIGIGSISKYLIKHGVHCGGYDVDPKMIDLCNRNINNSQHTTCVKDMFSMTVDDYRYKVSDLVYASHGVLEHFSDIQIKSIFDKYNRSGVQNIHYVPTDGYDEPSFGDERLLPYQYWLDLVKPKDYLLFNDNKDLLIINL